MKNKFEITQIYQVGKREHNEDSIFPNSEIETPFDNLFLVCDGVGGNTKGEIASDLVCTQINSFFVANNLETSTTEDITAALKFVETKFDSYIVDNPESAGMASTLTLLHLHNSGATIAHIGDSRVYQFRKGEIVFKTKDHSLVQHLLDLGEITAEEAANHPRRNEITRAIQGASIRSVKPDVSIITDIQEGDIFLLCSDGILEAFNDEQLISTFKNSESIDTIAAKITLECNKVSNDNFSAYFVQINKTYIDSLDNNTSENLGHEQLKTDEILVLDDKAELTTSVIVEQVPVVEASSESPQEASIVNSVKQISENDLKVIEPTNVEEPGEKDNAQNSPSDIQLEQQPVQVNRDFHMEEEMQKSETFRKDMKDNDESDVVERVFHQDVNLQFEALKETKVSTKVEYEKDKNRKKILMLITILLIVLFLCLAFIFFGNSLKRKDGKDVKHLKTEHYQINTGVNLFSENLYI